MFNSSDSLLLFVLAACLLILMSLERVLPLQASSSLPGRKNFLHLVRNLSFAAIGALLASALAVISLLTVLAMNQQWQFGLLYYLDTLDALNPPGLAFGIGWVIALLLFDGWQYAWHRMNHRIGLLWRFHAIHHADRSMDASTGVRFHFMELAISTLLRIPIVLLIGMQLQHLLVYELLALPVVLFHHANVRTGTGFDRAFRTLLVSPRMHRVHHQLEYECCNSNFSSLLSVWDRLFSTYRKPVDIEHASLGVPDLSADTLQDMLWLPFRKQAPAPPPHQ
ncbi:MAG: sterol desaturase family protein [Gammaproteobacteria bacterium]|nr:sterol desaturase family protein [Gammaproteobacteria bacterium]NND39494.1 sterol desaturase family protein [Pseudomonadales bacterium]NNM10701.1 sterol desaturase family protein [Pseudomonadales bacterium]